ncbi:uncharacterized protein LOC131213710 isoform X2 [Anopheles bellator]|uniref:uncharacterized protein LOC128269028 isoform X2 n=1 Tax=Anopheles cruzii TaxID=68878 RepID=UPI0022EC67A7|nr:uncharacterized protein LOC128269028 isoform X2 [Anopheles cruzii]XP_058063807.1 uncharacterized protein LOC131213710 isoform X2 [Anopheles bellator]
MSYIGNASDVEQEKNLSEYRRQRSSSNLIATGAKQSVGSPKMTDVLWNDKRAARAINASDDDDSEVSDSENFLAKGAFLLTPSHELSMDRAALICEKMNFKGCFSLTKTATGILFKFSSPEDYQAVFKKGFHKVTGARFYKKIAIPCRPQKTFMLYVFDVPEDLPEEDIRHSLYRFNSVVEVVRLVVHYQKPSIQQDPSQPLHAGAGTQPKPQVPKLSTAKPIDEQDVALQKESPPPPIRITLASLDEYNHLLQNGLDFYGATFFPTEAQLPPHAAKIATKRGARMIDGSIPGRVRELLPVFDAAGFSKIPPPASKTIKPRP